MLDSLINNAYWLLFAGTVLEGETALLLASLAASQGLLELPLVIATAFAGALVGDQISYQLFRRFGPAMVEHNPTLKRRSEKARKWLAGHPVKFILLTRFLWGLRFACMLAMAASDVRTRVFAPVNLIACAMWASAVGTAGYFFSGWVGQVVGAMGTISGRAPAFLAGMAAFVLTIYLLRKAVLRFWRSRESL